MIRDLSEEEHLELLMSGELLDPKHPFHQNYGGFEMRYMFYPSPEGECYPIGSGFLYLFAFYNTGNIKITALVLNADALVVERNYRVRIFDGEEIFPIVSRTGAYIYDYRGIDAQTPY